MTFAYGLVKVSMDGHMVLECMQEICLLKYFIVLQLDHLSCQPTVDVG